MTFEWRADTGQITALMDTGYPDAPVSPAVAVPEQMRAPVISGAVCLECGRPVPCECGRSSQITRLMSERSALEGEVTALRADAKTQEQQVVALERQLALHVETIDQAHSRWETLVGERDDLQERYATDSKRLLDELKATERETVRLEGQVARLTEAHALVQQQLQDEKQSRQQESAKHSQLVESTLGELEAAKRERDELQQHGRALEEQLVVLRRETEDQARKAQLTLQQFKEQDAITIEALQHQRTELERQLSELTTSLKEKEKDTGERITKLEKELRSAKAQAESATKELKKVNDDKDAAEEAKKRQNSPWVKIKNGVFYLVCLSGALYGLVEVFTGWFQWEHFWAIPVAIALELAGIKFHTDADAQKDAGEDAHFNTYTSYGIATTVVLLNLVGHAAMGKVLEAATFAILSALGFASYTMVSAFRRRVRLRAEGRADAVGLKFTKDHKKRHSAEVIARAEQLAAADTDGKMTVHEVLQRAETEINLETKEAEIAKRRKNLVTLLHQQKLVEFGGNKLAADIEVARYHTDGVIDRLMASDADHELMAASVLDYLDTERVGTGPTTETRVERLMRTHRLTSGTETGPEWNRDETPNGTTGETGMEPAVEPHRDSSGTGNGTPVEPAVEPNQASGETSSGTGTGVSVEPKPGPSGTTSGTKKRLFGRAPKQLTIVREAPSGAVDGVPNAKVAKWIGESITKTGQKPALDAVMKRFNLKKATASRQINAVAKYMTTPA